MVLLDAIYINNSGGKVLLDYLIENLEASGMHVHYLLDSRVFQNHPKINPGNDVTYLKSGLMSRHAFYKKNGNKFSKVLCFGNLPPSLKLNAKVSTYFHQQLFIKIPDDISLINKITIGIKMMVLHCIKKNTDRWIVQSENVRNGLSEKYNLKKETVQVIPFFPPLPPVDHVIKNKYKFVYISNVGTHKNHQRLIEGFCKFYDKFKIGELGLTISENATFEVGLIKSLQQRGYPIINFGFIGRNELSEIYASSEFLVFPSLSESFGLGLVEAIDSGCKVIGADLPYTYAVCQPSITFNPFSVDEIAEAFEKSLKPDIKPTIAKVHNQIEILIKLLQ